MRATTPRSPAATNSARLARRRHFEKNVAAPPGGRDESFQWPTSHQGTLLTTNVYVGNIPHDSTAEDLRAWFSDFGTVTHARVAADRDTGRPRGFGFVEMADGAENAIGALNGFRLDGRPLAVNVDAPPAAKARGRRH